jgi:hypothetical protein
MDYTHRGRTSIGRPKLRREDQPTEERIGSDRNVLILIDPDDVVVVVVVVVVVADDDYNYDDDYDDYSQNCITFVRVK